MPFQRDSLPVILDRVYAQYMSRFTPLDRTPRHNLLKVFSAVHAGMYHQLLGDLDFLALQLFPDTAEGEYLRAHWSSRITPLYAIAATGEVLITGIPDRPVPSGLLFASSSGERYYTEQAYRIGTDGTVVWYGQKRKVPVSKPILPLDKNYRSYRPYPQVYRQKLTAPAVVSPEARMPRPMRSIWFGCSWDCVCQPIWENRRFCCLGSGCKSRSVGCLGI